MAKLDLQVERAENKCMLNRESRPNLGRTWSKNEKKSGREADVGLKAYRRNVGESMSKPKVADLPNR